MVATMRQLLLFCAGLSAMAAGCLNQPSVDTATPECKPATNTSSGGAYGLDTGTDDEVAGTTERQVTFYKDLYPILTANSGSRTYKCTTCHAHMKTPEGLNSVSKVEETIESMKTGRMPRSDSRVTPAEIKLFDLWRLQGFQPGDPSDASADAEPAEKPSGNSGNCAG